MRSTLTSSWKVHTAEGELIIRVNTRSTFDGDTGTFRDSGVLLLKSFSLRPTLVRTTTASLQFSAVASAATLLISLTTTAAMLLVVVMVRAVGAIVITPTPVPRTPTVTAPLSLTFTHTAFTVRALRASSTDRTVSSKGGSSRATELGKPVMTPSTKSSTLIL